MITPIELLVFVAIFSSAFVIGKRVGSLIQRRSVNSRELAARPFGSSPSGDLILSVANPTQLRLRSQPWLAGTNGPISMANRIERWIAMLLVRAGVRMDGTTVVASILFLSVTVGLLMLNAELAPPMALAASFATIFVAIVSLQLKMIRRVARFNQQFPSTLELMARATRAGADLETAMRVAMSTSEEPLRSEFAQCVQQIQLGLTAAQASDDLAARLGTSDLQLFAHTITTHGQVGGRLAVSLEKLSSIIRERAELGEKIRAATGIARMAIFTVVAIAAFVFIYMQFAQPEYILKLSRSPFGQKLIIYGVVSECIGLIWVAITLKWER